MDAATAEDLAANKRLVLDYFHDVVAAFDRRPLSRYIAPDFVIHGADALSGIDAFDLILQRDFGDHPPLAGDDIRMLPPALVVADGDLVTIVFYMPMAVPDASGAAYDYYGFNTYRIDSGRIVERWSNEHLTARPQFLPEAAFGKAAAEASPHVSVDAAAAKQVAMDAHVARFPDASTAFVQCEGDLVVIATELPQPRPDGAGTWDYYAYDAYRISGGRAIEQWSGLDRHALPIQLSS